MPATMFLRLFARSVRPACLLFAGLTVTAAGLLSLPGNLHAEVPAPKEPTIAKASKEGESAMRGFKVPAGFKVELVAAEPELANPVAFEIDWAGRIWVCESFRQKNAVTDNRDYGQKWLDADLASQTVADRRAYHIKQLPKAGQGFVQQDDRIRLLEDKDGDGKFEKATVYASGFNDMVDGTGAGSLHYRGKVYYTNIPHLWMLEDKDGDGKADVRKSLHEGYGVRVAFRGHDMHGLAIGPDGKLYYSIGDRGLNVEFEGKQYKNIETGAVLRCNLDGSDLEIFATGLRNPQELAFDEFGNLFTGDNNSDSGDRARWVYVVEGGDTGWRMAYQYLADRGPFNREKIWHPAHAGQPAYIVPPIANFADGPSGLAYYPGTGMNAKYNNTFFLCDFRGGPVNSGIRTLKTKPKGATFELVEPGQFIWGILATDVCFGPDGSIYVSDWVNGWNGEGKGRIYRVTDSSAEDRKAGEATAKLLAAGFEKTSVDDLAKLLRHADQRVRQEAQFVLVDKKGLAQLLKAAEPSDHVLSRLHGIWGLGMLARRGESTKEISAKLLELAKDKDAEVRAQASRLIGDLKIAEGAVVLVELLKDENLRVRMFAALSLGKLKTPAAFDAVVALLTENADQDPMVRHAGIVALAGCGTPERLAGLSGSASPAVRVAAVVALRRLYSPLVARFLNDTDEFVVEEAARAINDAPIPSAMPQLAVILGRPMKSDPLIRRAMNANFRLGKPENAVALARFAARKDAPEARRVDALTLLSSWGEPSARDWVQGIWRPLEPRDAGMAATALVTSFGDIVSGPNKVREAGAKTAAKLGIKEVGPLLAKIAADPQRPARTRAESLLALVKLKDKEAGAVTTAALADADPIVRTAGRTALATLKPSEAIPLLQKAITADNVTERQGALETLAEMKDPQVIAALSAALDLLLAEKIPADSRLDLVSAARSQKNADLAAKLTKYESKWAKEDELAPYRDTLAGGDIERGHTIFQTRAEVSCVRCHAVGAVGGVVGPLLTKIGAEKQPEYLLEALVNPNKAIAKGFETVQIVTLDGKQHIGIVKSEDDKALTLMTAAGETVVVPKDEIEVRKTGKSAMPEDLAKKLTLFELRDLLAYLQSLKSEK